MDAERATFDPDCSVCRIERIIDSRATQKTAASLHQAAVGNPASRSTFLALRPFGKSESSPFPAPNPSPAPYSSLRAGRSPRSPFSRSPGVSSA